MNQSRICTERLQPDHRNLQTVDYIMSLKQIVLHESGQNSAMIRHTLLSRRYNKMLSTLFGTSAEPTGLIIAATSIGILAIT
jgi:hypothetical protein